MSNRRHVFISHHFADDTAVSDLTALLSKSGWDIRNSSIRANIANQQRLDRGEVSDRTLKRILRMKIAWAQAVVVLIGDETHARPWVAHEIEQANKLGKKIIGVYERGNQEAKIPPALEKYGSTIVAWNSDSIIKAVDGELIRFENPDGSLRAPASNPTRQNC